MSVRAPAILDHLTALSDPTRSRMLLLLDRHELTVSELCSIMQLPQSTASRHLKALADSGWIAVRAEGTSHLYTMTRDELDTAARRLWLLVREQVGPTPAATQDHRRLQAALADQRTKSQEFFSSSAGQWDRLRDELFGDRVHLGALAALADNEWIVGDLGCGTGQVSATLAPFVGRVIAVDSSAAMLQAARRRLAGFDNVELRRGELEALPIDDDRLDVGAMMLVLHHVPEPPESRPRCRTHAEAGRAHHHRRHAAARSGKLPAADGARVARIFGRAREPDAEGGRFRPRPYCPGRAGRAGQGTGVVRRDGNKTHGRKPRVEVLQRSNRFGGRIKSHRTHQ